ncbi:aldehyde ferredoxin oxidoreductase family protein [Candidatus Bathyarchaeota archaeon]|nr:aldehyde ferredoxin oxidoreductase family protein [Candidatus Bathyarchaeota archaeon]
MPRIKGGYLRKIARVDLNRGKFKVESVKHEFAIKYIGGRGWGARILWDEVSVTVDPLSADNKVIVATGPLTGLLIPGAAKTSFNTISPQTGLYGDSNMGGMFGTELKQAGFDALILEKAASNPCYIWIENGMIEVRDARHLWGMGSLDAEIALKKELGDELIRVASIGPAGEKLVKFACVTGDYGRQAGRTGIGAVLGSKKVKAIAVRGDQDIPVADIDALETVFEEAENYLTKHRDLRIWQRQGTMTTVDWSQINAALPTRNFQAATYENYQLINGDSMETRTKIANRACFMCPMACGQYNLVKQGSHQGISVEGPEYETASLLGSNCALPTIEDVVYANHLCDNFGIDTISAGNVAAFAMECFEKGILTKEQVGGLELRFGNSEALFQLLEMIAYRKGIGDLLAEGVKKASQTIGKGSEKFAMQVKGLEISGYDHRAAQAQALAYATCDVGAHHNRAWAITYDIKVGREAYSKDKAEWVIYLQHIRPLFDCLGTCRLQWVELALDPEYYARFYSAATGVPVTLAGLLKASERIYNLTRAISLRRGLTAKDDWLPDRDFEDPVSDGSISAAKLDRNKFRDLLRLYYELRGWDENGIPTREKLGELELGDVSKELEPLRAQK